jgi:hypothetical protein
MSTTSSSVPDVEQIPPPWLSPGQVVSDRLIIQKHLGSGTVGHAFVTTDQITNETVVAKVSKSPCADGGPILEEYRALRAINSSALPFPIGYCLHLQNEDIFPVLIVDYVEGSPLHSWVEGKSSREVIKALAALSAEMAALTAHPKARHGDLWERNIIVSESGIVRLIDPDGGNLGPSSTMHGTALLDIQGYTALLRKFVVGADASTINPLLTRVEASKGAANFSDAANHLLALLKNPLPSENAGKIQNLATVVLSDRADRQAQYRRIRDIRETEFSSLVAQAEAIFVAIGSSPLEKERSTLYENELAADQQPKGVFQHRMRQFTSMDGDLVNLAIDSVLQFTKPWPFPDRPGLLSKGTANVVIDGKAVASELLELWHVEAPRFSSFQIDRYVNFDNVRLERLAKVMVGLTIPGLVSPCVVNQKPKRFPNAMYQSIEPDAKRLGLDNEIALLPRNWLHVTLATQMRQGIGNVAVGSQLPTYFDIPRSARLQLVQDVSKRIVDDASEFFDVIYAIDVVDVDETNRSLSVLVEANTAIVKRVVEWRFPLSFPRGRWPLQAPAP